MDISKRFLELGEYGAAGLFEQPERSLFYRKAMGLRRYLETCRLPAYEGKPLYPSGLLDRDYAIVPSFMNGFVLMQDNRHRIGSELADAFEREFRVYNGGSVPPEHTIAGNMSLHSIPHYERVLREGLLAYIPRIEKIEDVDMRDGLLELIAGIQCWVDRCVSYLKSVRAEERVIQAMARVPLYPARDIYEAVFAWNAVMYLDGCDNLGSLANGLLPYFNGENIVPLLENLYDNLDINEGYSMSLHTNYTPLTLQCLEAVKGRRRPMIELFVDETTPSEVWEKAFEAIRTSCGQPAFYNPKGMLGGLQKKFPELTEEDLRMFCGSGCTESQIAGYTNVGSVDCGINLLWILERSMYSRLPRAQTFEEFYEGFIDDVRGNVDIVTREISSSQIKRSKYSPLPMRTLLIDDCIDNGTDFNQFGTRYKWSIVSFGGMINVIDSLLVIRDIVFRDKTCEKEAFLQLLSESDEQFLDRCRRHPCAFGTDDPEANAMATRVSTDIYSMLDDKKPAMSDGFLPASIMFRSVANFGRLVGATPDGRPAKAPLCDSLGAIYGKDVKGPTALLRSVASLDLERAIGTPVLNFNIDPEIEDEKLRALILGYMALGGQQMQLSCASAETLQEAYDHPELHRNLVVRVGGFSDYFNNLTDEMKRMIIARSIHK
ncbi:MAG: hypothetical protein IJB75_02145 [Oscillospiraceae bacterium]|nr:hypothetical protein [Oscillospiraceae bacterium]